MAELYSIWQEGIEGYTFTWRAQLHGFVGQFPTRASAELYVAAVKHERSRNKGMQPAANVTTKRR